MLQTTPVGWDDWRPAGSISQADYSLQPWGGLFYLDCPSWGQPSERLGGLPKPTFSSLGIAALCPPGAIPDTPGRWGCQHHPSPHELICSLSTAFTREKKALVKFPACQAVPGEGDRLFLGNTDIKAEKKREQQQ